MAYHEREPPTATREGAAMSQEERPASTAVTHALAAVAAAVGAPEFVLPWLDRFYDGNDVEVLLAAGGPAGLADVEPERLERALRRAVLDRDEAGAYAPATFADRLDICAMFEGWGTSRGDVRRRLADWATDDYAASVRDDLEALRSGAPGDSREIDYTYLLLPEAEAVIAAEEHVYLWPCDCRAIVGSCDKPVDVCLRFDNERGLGGEISRERAVADPARDGRRRSHAHRLPRAQRRRHARDLQLLHRLLLPAPGSGAAGRRERLAAPPAPCRHRLATSARSAAPAPPLPVRRHHR